MVWFSGNVVGHMNVVTQCQAGLILRWVTVHGYTGQLSLIIPLW